MNLLALGVNHHTAPLALRERLAVPPAGLPDALRALTRQVAPGVLLSTCNRLEVYTLVGETPGRKDPGEQLENFLVDYFGLAAGDLPPHLYRYRGRECVRHLFRVASGLDSMVVGEWEILGQVRAAFSAAAGGGSHVRGPLSRLFHQALRVGRKVHHEANIGGNRRRSVSQVSVRLAQRLLGDLSERQVLLIGAGEAGQLAGRALAAAGAGNLVVTNRTYRRAEELSGELGAMAAPFERLHQSLAESDAAISTTASPDYLLHRETMQEVMNRRSGRPLLLIDIAVPRDIEPEVGLLAGVRLCDIDDLGADSAAGNSPENNPGNGNGEPEATEAERLVAREADAFMEWWESLDTISAITAIREHAEDIRRAEVNKTMGRLRNLWGIPASGESVDWLNNADADPVAGGTAARDLELLAARLDAMTAALVKKLLHHPTMYLREAKEPAQQQLIRDLFNLDGDDRRNGRC